jgi:hypothetical protein
MPGTAYPTTILTQPRSSETEVREEEYAHNQPEHEKLVL